MIIYKDILTGDEMLSDTYQIKEVMEILWKVNCQKKTITATKIDDKLIGGNASQEEQQECLEEGSSSTEMDIVADYQLQSMPPFDRKGFLNYFKPYCKKVLKKLEEQGETEKAAEFKAKAPAAVAYLSKNIKDFDIYSGESSDVDGSFGYLDWEDGTTPYMLFFKHALIEEKV
ncbi:translationally-controlled tumor protein homolog [Clavelina lepadiformis]|uniref:TCTP domain-containing protein n=1 Tax=Clavelina lepadiformis TaxID=159417 RepID=A0ABP0H5N4_CLALP